MTYVYYTKVVQFAKASNVSVKDLVGRAAAWQVAQIGNWGNQLTVKTFCIF